jgi:ribosomal protein S18 acetylase RimI-like enzyme
MVAFQIQRATRAQLDAVAGLFDAYRQFYDQPSDPALATAFMRQRIDNEESVILLATHEGQHPVGFCQLYPTFCSVAAAPIYVLYDLFVVLEARRCGVGQALLRVAQALAVEHGKARMDLTTAKTNTAAQSVYEALGWVRDDVFYTYSHHIKDAQAPASP